MQGVGVLFVFVAIGVIPELCEVLVGGEAVVCCDGRVFKCEADCFAEPFGFEDDGLADNTRYVYRVYVYDDQEAYAGRENVDAIF